MRYSTSARKAAIILTLSIFCLIAAATVYAQSSCLVGGAYTLPPDIAHKKYAFAGASVPLNRPEAAARVLDRVNYLLMDHRAVTLEILDRLVAFEGVIGRILAEEKIPADALYVAGLLSRLSPRGKTRGGGVGWWALGPLKDKSRSSSQWVSTAEWDDRRDPVISTRIAASILQNMSRKNVGDWLMILSGYLDGSEKVEEIATQGKGYGFWDLVMPIYSENFIPEVVALKIIDTHKGFYQLPQPKIQPWTYDSLDQLKLTKDVPLYKVAQWAGIIPRAIWELNPATDPAVGILPIGNGKASAQIFLRTPKGMGDKVRRALVAEKYLSE